jgi:hypothetical protein
MIDETSANGSFEIHAAPALGGVKEDTKRLHSIIGIAMAIMRNPLDSLSRYIAIDLVNTHVKVIHEIHDARTRQLALNLIAEIGFAQKHYKFEVARQAPALVGPAAAANAAIAAEYGDDYQPPATVVAGMLQARLGAP